MSTDRNHKSTDPEAEIFNGCLWLVLVALGFAVVLWISK